MRIFEWQLKAAIIEDDVNNNDKQPSNKMSIE